MAKKLQKTIHPKLSSRTIKCTNVINKKRVAFIKNNENIHNNKLKKGYNRFYLTKILSQG